MNYPEQITQKLCGCKIEIDKQTIKVLECGIHNWEISMEKWQKTGQKK